jgi:tRNA-dihydrouridine synthase
MIGRGAIGKPWLLNDISKSLYGNVSNRSNNTIPLVDLVLLHFDKILTFYGKELGLRMFRKHLASYLKNTTFSLFDRKTLMTESSINRLKSGIHFAFDKQALEVRL